MASLRTAGSVGVSGRDGPAYSDRAVVERVRDGDLPAFSELYRAHAGAARTVARAHVRDAEAAADVVQEAFARALEQLPTLRQPERFRPWLLAIVRHVAIDRARSQGRLRTLDDDGDEPVSPEPGPAQQAELSELVGLLERCIRGLAPRDATAAAMVTHLGCSSAEVGVELGVSSGTAKVIVHRARRRLRGALTLQLLAGHRASACAELVDLWKLDDAVGVTRHVRTCQHCVGAAGRELVSTSWSA